MVPPPAEAETSDVADEEQLPADLGVIPVPGSPVDGNEISPTSTHPPEVGIFEDDWIGPVVLIELERPAITDLYLEESVSIGGEASAGAVSGSVAVEHTDRYEIGKRADGPVSSEDRLVVEGAVGPDAPIFGNGSLPEVGAGVGGYIEVPLTEDSGEAIAGIHAKVDLFVAGGEVQVGTDNITRSKASWNLPIRSPGQDPSIVTYGPAAARSTAIVYERSTDNLLRAAVPLAIYQQYNGDIYKIHEEYIADTVNDEQSNYTPAGRITHINTVTYDQATDTIHVRTVNEILQESTQKKIIAARSNRTYVEAPSTRGEIVFPLDDDEQHRAFDYSGDEYKDVLTGNGACHDPSEHTPKYDSQGNPLSETIKVEYYDGTVVYIPRQKEQN